MAAKPLEIDLQGKSLEEVMKMLQDNGFIVTTADISTTWDSRDKALGGKEKGPPVHVIWIKDDEAPLLTVTIFNGRKKTLEPGYDLHLFDRPPDQPKGQDWSTLYTLNIMR